MDHLWDAKIEYLKGVGPKRAELLTKELGIRYFSDLLTYYPFRYVDRRNFVAISKIESDSYYILLRGKIVHIEEIGKGSGQRMTAILQDASGRIELVWFKGISWIKDQLKLSHEYIVFGKPSEFKGRYNIVHPELELFTAETQIQDKAFMPMYSTTEKMKTQGLASRSMGKLTQTLLQEIGNKIGETLPGGIIRGHNLLSRREALKNIHYPESPEKLLLAEHRLKFEELFFLQLEYLKSKNIRTAKSKGFLFSEIGEYFNRFFHQNLPFRLTKAQERVIKEIRRDMKLGHQMNRLLQGDVGSGKTLVALMTMLIALDNQFQACLIAPTEILAVQHYNSICQLLKDMDIHVEILTGSTNKAKRKVLKEQLLSGEIHILIGTHALFEDDVVFQNLGLVVIDEQHRFGVEQRAKMWTKNHTAPHILVMTATPIPRTLAMTVYGDLDCSVIDELPPGRKEIKTLHFFDSARLRVFAFMKEQIKAGRQVYVVYPLINESEKLDLKDLMDGYLSISRDFPMPEYQTSIVHGQMKSVDKDYEMNRFKKGETHIMVSTTVIEVGVDVPNASVMVIENAERFGLSQLHQLRGRVGRGAEQSYCLLMTGNKLSADARIRIQTMVKTNDGFEIADADLKLRGPGDLQGTQQSGILNLKIADLVKDESIIHQARQAAMQILELDPNLQSEENRILQYQFIYKKDRIDWGKIS